MSKPNYAMFSDAGNEAVEAIVSKAKVLKLSWDQVEDELISLSDSPNGFVEATDTMVREAVYVKLFH